jgi:hypothetical protein
MDERDNEANWRHHFCHEKAISNTYSEYVFVTLVIQHIMLIRHIILSSVTYPALSHFSTLSYKWHDFRKNLIEYKICVLIFTTKFV